MDSISLQTRSKRVVLPYSDSSNKRPRTATAKSCKSCIHDHMRCDRVRPSCQNCTKRKKECVYASDLLHPKSSSSVVFPIQELTSTHQPISTFSSCKLSKSLPSTLAPAPQSSLSAMDYPNHHHHLSSSSSSSSSSSYMIEQQNYLIRQLQELIDSQKRTIDGLKTQLEAALHSQSHEWDPDEAHFHDLVCHSKRIFDADYPREEAVSHVVAMLIRFALTRPSRIILICRIEPGTKTTICHVSEALQKWTSCSLEVLQDCFDRNISPFSSESRAALLNPLVESVVTSPSDGNHTFLWEKSSE